MSKKINKIDCIKPKARIYSDGSVKGASEGPGGYGVIIQYITGDNKIKSIMEYTEAFKVTTNNRMELMGVIQGLESLSEPFDVTIYSDSKYVVDAFNQNWIDSWIKNGWHTASNQKVKNVDLWKRLIEAKKLHECKFVWVKGHNGHAENERCDYLARSSADGIKFERNDKGILEPVKATLKEDVGLIEADLENPKISLSTIAKEYIDGIGKNLKNNTVILNGVKFILDEECNLSPHPNEDLSKCKKVIEDLNKLSEDENFSKLIKEMIDFSSYDTFTNLFNDIFTQTIFTGNSTIPKIEIIKNDK